MARRFKGDRITDMITEVGDALSDGSGFGEVILSGSHYPVVTVVVSSYDNSFNSFVVSSNSFGFIFGTSAPNSKITYKVISTRA